MEGFAKGDGRRGVCLDLSLMDLWETIRLLFDWLACFPEGGCNVYRCRELSHGGELRCSGALNC